MCFSNCKMLKRCELLVYFEDINTFNQLYYYTQLIKYTKSFAMSKNICLQLKAIFSDSRVIENDFFLNFGLTRYGIIIQRPGSSFHLFYWKKKKSPPGSSVHETFPPRVLERVAISFSRGFSQPRDRTHISCISCIVGWFLTTWITWEAPILMN